MADEPKDTNQPEPEKAQGEKEAESTNPSRPGGFGRLDEEGN